MKELDELTDAIIESIPEDAYGDLFWCVCPGMTEDEWRVLPPSLRFEVEVLASPIRKLVPADVEFVLMFDEGGAHFSLEYADGKRGISRDGDYFDTLDDLFAFLREIVWPEFRAAKLK